MYEIQEKFEQVHKLYCFYLKKLMATNTLYMHIRLNYKATYNHKITCTKIDNKSPDPDNINTTSSILRLLKFV